MASILTAPTIPAEINDPDQAQPTFLELCNDGVTKVIMYLRAVHPNRRV